MALTRWPTEPPVWLIPWTIWKLRAEQGPRPSGTPTTIPKYGWEFRTWVLWRRKNRPPPRPDIIELIPKWAYPMLRQIMLAVPLVPPPPPLPPAVADPPNSWHLPFPILYTSHGWKLDSQWRDNDEGLQKARDAGFRTIALQSGLFRDQDPDRCRAFGFDVAVWGTPRDEDAAELVRAQAGGWIPQVEGDEEFANALRLLRAGVGAGLSLSFVTTFNGLDRFVRRNVGTPQEQTTTEEVEELAQAGCTHAQVECYTGDMQPMSVTQMMYTGTRWRGIYHSIPVIGLGREGVTVGSYQPELDPWGRQMGAYLAEPMRPADWAAVKAL